MVGVDDLNRLSWAVRRLGGVWAGLLLSACSSLATGDQVSWTAQEVDFRREVDLLLVVDDAPEMTAKKQALARGLPELLRVFSDPWQPVDLQLAMVSSRSGLRQDRTQSCQARSFRPVQLLSGDGAKATTKLLSEQPNQGCGRNSVLEAMHSVLSGELRPWIRKNALLVTVMVSAERDCSLDAGSDTATLAPDQVTETPMQGEVPSLQEQCFRLGASCEGKSKGSYASCEISPRSAKAGLLSIDAVEADLLALKGQDPRKLMSTAVSGAYDDEGSLIYPTPRDAQGAAPGVGCATWHAGQKGEVAHAPIRLRAMAEQSTFVDEQALFSICMDDLRRPLTRIAEQARARLSPVCILDAEPESSRLGCKVIEQSPEGRLEIPECERDGKGYVLDSEGHALRRPRGHARCVAFKGQRGGEAFDAMSDTCRRQGAKLELELHRDPGTRPSAQASWTLHCPRF